MFEPKSVSKLSYYTATAITITLCLSGLIWQVWQISDNFFKFEVLRDIEVLLPKQDIPEDTVVYVCFKSHELYDADGYRNFINGTYTNGTYRPEFLEKDFMLKMTVKDRWKVFLSKDDIISYRVESEFMRGILNCYEADYFGALIIKGRLSGVKSFFLSVGNELPQFSFDQLVQVSDFGSIHQTNILPIKSYSYSLLKLPSPYTDKCIDYWFGPQLNQTIQYNVFARCETMTLLESNAISSREIVTKDTPYVDNLIFPDQMNPMACSYILQYPDCSLTTHFTQILKLEPLNRDGDPTLQVEKVRYTDPSFVITSKPRIDNIDYITYTLGALGSWLGFSFIGINPVPYFLVMKKSAVVPQNDTTMTQTISHEESVPGNRSINLLRMESIAARDKLEQKLQSIFKVQLLELESRLRSKNDADQS